ncbi:hypothetical protein PV328_002489 [Microctonus aethiopoides]|uniref:Mutator-like transposase domain-containing protein n=1 Tax=Microctonus aethiopoides TaxID=144406 RepID=A0AA39KJH1_9HYME|nr:hypothetical protein PV328_002489 [Microctonus aethiopoides]
MSTYPKSKCSSSYRSSRPRKRSFHGNQFTNSKSSKCDDENDESINAEKLSNTTSENVIVNPLHSYRIIEFITIFTALSDILICRSCHQDVKFAETGIRGLGFKLIINCKCAGSRQIPSGPYINTGFEINRRIAFVMRLLGIGQEGLNLFCNYMDICSGISEETYNSIYNHIHGAVKKVFEYCCRKAAEVEEEKIENEKYEKKRPVQNFKPIMAVYNHMISTDDNPKHDDCPAGPDSWCNWKLAEASGITPEVDPTPELHPDVIQKEILPTFADLSRNYLLKKCLGGHTQNANKSFNSTVWRLAPKDLNCELKVIEVASYLAACLLNEGSSSLLLVMNELNIVVGNRSYNYAHEMDKQRSLKSSKRRTTIT